MDKVLYISNLKRIRQFCGLTLVDIAQALNISHVTVLAYERGEFRPSQHNVDRLVELFTSKGVTLDIVQEIESITKRIKEDK